MTRIAKILLGSALVLGTAGPLVQPAAAQHYDRRYYYRDGHGRWHKRHSGIGAGKGALIGGAAGVGVGALVGGPKGALVGGALGAGTGALIGNHAADNRHRDEARYDSNGRRY